MGGRARLAKPVGIWYDKTEGKRKAGSKMYAEELKHKPPGTLAGILITLGIVALVLVCAFFVAFLQYWLKLPWLQLFLYGAGIVAVVFIVKYWITEYIYLIEKDRITFGRRIGKREKELLSVPFRDIVSFGGYAEMERKISGKKVFRYTFRKKPEWFVIDCTGCAIIMTVTEKYIDCLKKVKGRKRSGGE